METRTKLCEAGSENSVQRQKEQTRPLEVRMQQQAERCQELGGQLGGWVTGFRSPGERPLQDALSEKTTISAAQESQRQLLSLARACQGTLLPVLPARTPAFGSPMPPGGGRKSRSSRTAQGLACWLVLHSCLSALCHPLP